ncbi:putative nuclease HARBI1 [Onychostoma macrolepis]|uniref:putative nuclease HARBI1 n=1 Tax=Onychostoma macrolepis TaxID=369639 RepID=UPI00272A1F6D|nr:putative nuclease HARBI1 [Onychostoma macrolepis]
MPASNSSLRPTSAAESAHFIQFNPESVPTPEFSKRPVRELHPDQSPESASALEYLPVPVPRKHFAVPAPREHNPNSESSPQRAPVPQFSPEENPVLKFTPKRAAIPNPRESSSQAASESYDYDMLDDMAVIDRCRLPRGEIVQLLNVIGPQLMHATRRNFALSPDVQLVAALRYDATGSFLQVLGDELGLSKASVSRAVQAVTYALLPPSAEHIQFPATRQAMSDIQEYFFLTHYHIPQVNGVIDGTLIPITTPSVDGHIYACHKGYPAINRQMICDHKCLITDIVARWPGSMHDSIIFSNSSVGQDDQNSQGQRISTEAISVANPVNNREADFNEAHRVAQSIVKHTLGRWKLCFRAIHKSSGGLLFVPQKCCAVITVTATLHNIAVWARVPLDIREEDEELEEENEDGMRPHDDQPRHVQYMAGFHARQQVIDTFFLL